MKEFVFYYVLLTFIANMHGLFLGKIKKVLQLPMLFKKFWKSLIVAELSLNAISQIKYGLIKAVNFITAQWNHG